MYFNNILTIRQSVTIVLLTVFLYACKENTILPANLVPEIDNIFTFGNDTSTIITRTVYQDSLVTGGTYDAVRFYNNPNLYHALGTIANDPVFGKTTASIHVEVLPPTTKFSFKSMAEGTTRTVDSIVLAVPFKRTYGDTISNTTQTFRVFRSTKSFSKDSAQFEFTNDSVDYAHPLSNLTVDFKTFATDSPLVGNVKLAPQLRFKLNSWFADSLQTQVDARENGAADNYTAFLNWWKGFHIQPDTNNGNTLAYFDTYNTRMYIYYRYTNTSNQADTTVDIFSFDPNNCNRFNTITHNYAGKTTNYFLQLPDNGIGDSITFVQNDPGLATEIRFPYLTNLENCIINKAELKLTAISPYAIWTDTATYGILPRIQVLVTDSTGADKILEEYIQLGSGFVDGNRKSNNINGQDHIQYSFSLNHSIQKVISQKNTNFRLKLIGFKQTDVYPAAYRLMLAGNKHSSFKPTLNIIYTKLNK
jgi:hypothetical protein